MSVLGYRIPGLLPIPGTYLPGLLDRQRAQGARQIAQLSPGMVKDASPAADPIG